MRWLFILLASATIAQADDTDFTSIGKANHDPSTILDSCRFADIAAVEKMVGEKLSLAPFTVAAARPDENGTTCRFQFSGFRSIDVDVIQKGGDKTFEVLTGITSFIDKKTEQPGNLNQILGLAGDWDEVRMVGTNQMAALQGDRLILISANGLLLFQDAVTKLIEDIYARIDEPKGPQGSDGLAAAQVLYKNRPQQRDACDLVSDADLVSILGMAPKSRKSYGKSCDIDFGNGFVSLKVSWDGGANEMAMLALTMRAHLATGILPAAEVEKLKAEADAPLPEKWEGHGRAISNPAWNVGFGSGVMMGAARDDVFVSLYASSQFSPQQEVKILAGAINRALGK